MCKCVESQFAKVKELKSSVLISELLKRREIEVLMLCKTDNKSVLYLNENGEWSMKRLGHED